jgi:hypothetical protein
VVLEPLLIICISNGSYSKITYSYNSHISDNSHALHTKSQLTYKHIHKFINIINIDIAIYNLQHTSLYIICISNSVVHPTQDHISPTYIYSIKVHQQRYQLVGRRRERPWTTLGGLVPPSADILRALTLLRLLTGLLLRPLSGLLLLSFSIDILSKCLVVLPNLLKFFLGYNQFLF